MIERINAVGRARSSRSTCPRGSTRRPARCRAPRSAATLTVSFGAAKVGLAVAPGRFHAGAVHVASIGLEPGDARALRSSRRRCSARGAAQERREHEVPSRLGARRRRLARADRRADARGARRPSAPTPATSTVAAPESTLPVLEAGLLEAVKRPLPEDARGPAAAPVGRADPRGAPSGPTPSRSDRASGAATARASSSGCCSSALAAAGRARRRRPLGASSRSSARAATVLTPHAGELAAAARRSAADEIDAHRLAAVRRAASRFGSIVLLKGADTLVAAPREGVLVAAVRRALARRPRAPATCSPASSPRSSPRVSSRARPPRPARSRTGSPRGSSSRSGARRERPAARRSSARSPARAGSQRLTARMTSAAKRDHDRPRGAPPQRRAGCARLLAARRALGGRQGRRLRPRCRRLRRGPRSRRVRPRSASRPSPRRSCCAPGCPASRIIVMGPAADSELAALRGGAARARGRRHGSPRASPSTSSSTPAWAAGASRSSRSLARETSSG